MVPSQPRPLSASLLPPSPHSSMRHAPVAVAELPRDRLLLVLLCLCMHMHAHEREVF